MPETVDTRQLTYYVVTIKPRVGLPVTGWVGLFKPPTVGQRIPLYPSTGHVTEVWPIQPRTEPPTTRMESR